MSPALFLVLFLIVLSAGQAHIRAQPAAPPEAAKSVIEGRVVRAVTGELLKKASVMLQRLEGREPPRGAITNAEGYFIIQDIEPGRYRLTAMRNGYATREYGQRSAGRPGTVLTLAPGQRMRDILIELIPAAVIAGRVYDEDGEPTPGALVEAWRYAYSRDRRELLPIQRAATNDLGEYRIFGLGPGTYYVSATFSPERSFGFAGLFWTERRGVRESADEGYAPTYFPGTNDPTAASPIELRAGDEFSGVDFLLLPTRTVRVRGRVLNPVAGRSRAETTVMLLPRGGVGRRSWMNPSEPANPSDGSFELRGIVPGSYYLLAMWHQDEEFFVGHTPIEVGPAGLDNVSVTIEAGVEVSGRLGVERLRTPGGGEAATAREANFSLNLESVRVFLQPKDDLYLPAPRRTNQLREDGTFELRNVPRGDYWIRLVGVPSDYYLKAARLAGENVLEEGLSIAGGALPGRLELTVSSNGARVEGAVLAEDNEPFSGAVVALVPEPRHRSRMELYRSTATDQFGRFTLRGLPPGEYKLFAWEELEPGAHRDPDFLRLHEDRGQDVRLREGEQAAVELKLIRSGEAARR